MSLATLDFESLSPDGGFILQLLQQQQQLTAVEKFAQKHEQDSIPLLEGHYRELIPLNSPNTGEQYAFEVDLDSCSGCKACVTACHSLNGLEPEEAWRGVGLLHGGTNAAPAIQHVTSACHHCIDPACMSGCPVKAYVKDEATGIVRHLDDQCIGCKYCIFKCPYDVPKYSASKGIVRKCDMCHQRLAVGEAPACVQACPNKAIRITVVRQQEVIEAAQANSFLAGAPEPQYTLPTTVYKTKRGMPRNMLPADFFAARPQHAHPPLVLMLVLTQMAVGAVAVDYFLQRQYEIPSSGLVHATAALVLAMIGLSAATFHLGRPFYAFRALLGLRSSWMSREILAFGIFPVVSAMYAAAEYVQWSAISHALEIATVVSGILAVWCSAMIYIDTNRPFWNASSTNTKFFGTTIVLGIPASLLIMLCSSWLSDSDAFRDVVNTTVPSLFKILMGVTAVKLFCEFLIVLALRGRSMTPLKRTAMLLKGELASIVIARIGLAFLGGFVFPSILLANLGTVSEMYRSPFLFSFILLSLVILSIGEFLERYLFFAAVVAPKMPGGQAS